MNPYDPPTEPARVPEKPKLLLGPGVEALAAAAMVFVLVALLGPAIGHFWSLRATLLTSLVAAWCVWWFRRR